MGVDINLIANELTQPRPLQNQEDKERLVEIMYKKRNMKPEAIKNFKTYSPMGGGSTQSPYECDVPMYFTQNTENGKPKQEQYLMSSPNP